MVCKRSTGDKINKLSLYVKNWSVVKGKYWLDWIYLEDLPRYLMYKINKGG
jgi:hypothetical protein